MEIVWTGTLKKMRVEAAAPVRYHLTDGWFEKEAVAHARLRYYYASGIHTVSL